jgi:hypothetical protein
MTQKERVWLREFAQREHAPDQRPESGVIPADSPSCQKVLAFKVKEAQ